MKQNSRRGFLKLGLMLPSPAKPVPQAEGELPIGIGKPNPGMAPHTLLMPDGIPMDLEIRPSPATLPFTRELPIPPIALPVRGEDGKLDSGHENLEDPYGNSEPKDMVNPTPVWSQGVPDTRRYQRWDEFPAGKFYQVNIRMIPHDYDATLTGLSSDGLGTVSFGYGDVLPGPTFVAFYGEPIIVRMANGLPDCNSPADFPPFGIQSTTTHLHNSHTASESDGFPMGYVDPGQWHDHHYPNIAAGDDWRERMTSLWYHDHRMDFTASNVYAGLSGFYFLFDKPDDTSIPDQYKDTGSETDVGTLRFPGEFVTAPNGDITGRNFDVPIMLHDVLFDAEGQAVFDVFNTDGILGDKFTCNRTVQPKLTTERRRYRLRIQNGGPSRFYRLHLVDGAGEPILGVRFWVISSDGNLLHKPLEKDFIELSVAQRHDVIVDFGLVPGGTNQVFLYNSLEQVHGRGPTGRNLLETDRNVNRDSVLRFDLVPVVTADQSNDPTGMTEIRPMPDEMDDLASLRQRITTATPSDFTEENVEWLAVDGSPRSHTRRYLEWVDRFGAMHHVYYREFEFDYDGGLWTINGLVADMTELPEIVAPDSIEVWRIANSGGDWSHPVHIHFEEFRLIEFNGKEVSEDDPRFGRKDVLTIGPSDQGLCMFRFRDFEGHYVIHCHNVIHEDHAMMLRWNIGTTVDVHHHSIVGAHRFCNGILIPDPQPEASCDD